MECPKCGREMTVVLETKCYICYHCDVDICFDEFPGEHEGDNNEAE